MLHSKIQKTYSVLLRSGFVVVVLAIIDQVTKWWFISTLRWTPSLSVKATFFLDFVYSWNYGISFGLFRNYYQYSNALFTVTNVAIVVYLCYLMYCSSTSLGVKGYAFVVGGAVGNLIDRLVRGAVFDFIYLHYQGHGFPVFNLADCFITVGVLVLLMDHYRSAKNCRESKQ